MLCSSIGRGQMENQYLRPGGAQDRSHGRQPVDRNFGEGDSMIRGVRYLVDDQGDKTAVVLDLRLHGDLWEDVYDALLARKRRREPRESLSQVRRRLQRARKLKRDG
jgi:hypothetical protein